MFMEKLYNRMFNDNLFTNSHIRPTIYARVLYYAWMTHISNTKSI